MHDVGLSTALCIALVGAFFAAQAVVAQQFTPDLDAEGELPEKRGWNNFQAGYGKRGWNNFNGGYGKRAYDDADIDESYELEKRAWNSGFAGGLGKRAWNSGFAGGMGKRAWNSGFAGGMGKRAWNSGFAGGMGKRAWNSGFAGGMGKRAWNSGFGGAMGKRSGELSEALDNSREETESDESGLVAKRNWASRSVRGAWGKRSTTTAGNSKPSNAHRYVLVTPQHYHAWLRDNYAKRTRGWLALRGMWGKRKRSDPSIGRVQKISDEEAAYLTGQQQHPQNMEQDQEN